MIWLKTPLLPSEEPMLEPCEQLANHLHDRPLVRTDDWCRWRHARGWPTTNLLTRWQIHGWGHARYVQIVRCALHLADRVEELPKPLTSCRCGTGICERLRRTVEPLHEPTEEPGAGERRAGAGKLNSLRHRLPEACQIARFARSAAGKEGAKPRAETAKRTLCSSDPRDASQCAPGSGRCSASARANRRESRCEKGHAPPLEDIGPLAGAGRDRSCCLGQRESRRHA